MKLTDEITKRFLR